MFYDTYDIVFQEIPDEVTLAINISGCPNRCNGCHSPHLQQEIGTALTAESLEGLLSTYGSTITCVCFMGGDADPQYICTLAQGVKRHHPTLHTGWYSGRELMPPIEETFDYVKLGPYRPECGPLSSPTTNQHLYHRKGGQWEDITFRFWKSKQ